jgi:Ca-activated chloride channel homolog
MITRRFALLATIAAALAGIGWTSRSRPARAATTESAAPGQLTLLDRKGEPAGLCALKHTDVTADIAGYVARVTVRQEFVNPSREPVEAMYSFPLPSDAAVDDMTMTIGTRVVRGEIKRKEEALAIYEAAKANGQAAALLDQERPNIFTQQVANLMPGAKVVITISYVNLLKYQEGQYEFVFPIVVGPRYIPGAGYVAGAQRGSPGGVAKFDGDPGTAPVVVDAHRITPPVAPPGTRAGHDISLAVRLDAGVPLQALDAGLHKVSIVPRGRTGATVTLTNQQEIPNKDFILRYTAAGSEMQEGLLAFAPVPTGSTLASNVTNAANGYFTMIVQPPLAPPKEEISPKEMVFVIDQTGSQSGWPIAKAKETMRHCIANMNPGDTFQLIGFNTDVYPCFPGPVSNTPGNVAKALQFLEPLEGNGGTDILKSVEYALNIPDDPERLRIVCYMTDGYVGNDMQILNYIQKHRGRARMFPFGIGNSVNRFLIEGMAREGRGAAEVVAVNTNAGAQFGGAMPDGGVKGAKDVADRFYRRIASPLLLDVHVEWNGLPVEDVYPKQIPDVFSAGPIVLKGRYSHAAEGDVTIHGLLRGKPWSRTIHVVLPATHPEGSAIETLWAREKIEDLQSQDWLGAQTNSPHPEIQQQIINTALEYHLMSQYTSFVAVEQRVVNIGGRQRLLDVPVELPDGVPPAGIAALEQAQKPDHWSLNRRLGGFAGGGLSRAGATKQGGTNLLREFGITGQVLANPDDNSIVNSPSGGAAGLAAGKTKAASQPLKESEAARQARAGAPGSSGGIIPGGSAHAGDAAPLGYGLGRNGKDARSAQTGKPQQVHGYEANLAVDAAAFGSGRPAPLTPAQRRELLEQTKLSSPLRAKLAAFRKAKGAKAAPVEVQVWVSTVPANGLAKLKALGFKLAATLTPNRLLLGTVSIDKLDALLSLPWVRGVELPKFK